MNIKLLEDIALKKMGKIKGHLEREPGHIYYHGLRTAKLSLNLRKLIAPESAQYDNEIYIGALFHDIGKGIEPHAETGYAIVNHILSEYLNQKELEMISEIVRYHCKRVSPNDYPIWVRIVQDADILDHMGTTEVWLNFLYCAYENRSIDMSIEWYHSEKRKSFDLKLKDLLNFEVSKQIWDEKVEFVNSFIKRLEIEAEGGLLI